MRIASISRAKACGAQSKLDPKTRTGNHLNTNLNQAMDQP